jgi:hypothetical protein
LFKISTQYFSSLLNFIVFHNYILYNNNILLQTVGIPQGGNCSSILADLYLYCFELEYNTSNHIYLKRYLDDIISFNFSTLDLPDFSFYPPELELIDNDDSNNCNFLDLNINNLTQPITTNIYDKKLCFDFIPINFITFNSCLHISVYKNILIGQIIRIHKLCHPDFISENLINLKNYVIKNNYPIKMVNQIFKGFNLII